MKITADFPGGNIKVNSVEKANGITKVKLEQDIRDTDIWWFYWCFRVDEAEEGTVDFHFQNKDVINPKGVATSTDGDTWSWLQKERIDGTHFRYEFKEGEASRYFSFTIPYVVKDFEKFYDGIKDMESVELQTLTVSEKGRKIPLLTFGSGKKDIFFTARHHCCESTASYVLEGTVSALLKDHKDMLSEYKFHVIPFTDIDGTQQGDQGKNRIPHDHNRDYCDEPIYNYTKAIYEYTENRDITAFIDFHSPWCWGGGNDEPHIHLGPETEPSPYLQDVFMKKLEEITKADKRDVIPYNGIHSRQGEKVNAEGTPSAKNYFKLVRKADISLTVENPYAGNLAKGYTPEQLRIFGEHIKTALKETLK